MSREVPASFDHSNCDQSPQTRSITADAFPGQSVTENSQGNQTNPAHEDTFGNEIPSKVNDAGLYGRDGLSLQPHQISELHTAEFQQPLGLEEEWMSDDWLIPEEWLISEEWLVS